MLVFLTLLDYGFLKVIFCPISNTHTSRESIHGGANLMYMCILINLYLVLML